MFIRYLAEQALNIVKSEKKPRRNIQYKDMGEFIPQQSFTRANLPPKQTLLPESTPSNFSKT